MVTLPIQLRCAVDMPTVTATADDVAAEYHGRRPPVTLVWQRLPAASWMLLAIAGALASVMVAVGKGMPSFFRR